MKKIISIILISALSFILLTGCVVQEDDTNDFQSNSSLINTDSIDSKEDILEEIVTELNSGNLSYDEVLDELEINEITEQEFNEYSDSLNDTHS